MDRDLTRAAAARRSAARAALLLGLALGAQACAGGRMASKIPRVRLERLYVTACEAGPSEAAIPSFLTSLGCVAARAQLADISGTHSFVLMYYDPDGTLYLSTKEDWSFGAHNRQYHRRAVISHRLPVAGEQASLLPGQWRVSAWMDGAYQLDASFRLERPALPEASAINEGKDLYLGLQYEQAAAQLSELLPRLSDPRLAAEAYWWLALSQASLGETDLSRQSLDKLLQADASYAVSPDAAKEAGAQETRATLEELRSNGYPGLYRKTASAPGIELSKAERPPVVQKRWTTWRKLAVYVGLPLAAVVTVAVIVVGAASNQLADLPMVEILLDPAIRRDARLGNLCEGQLPLRIGVSGGRPPLELLVTAAKVGGLRDVQVAGLNGNLTSVDTVLCTGTLDEQGFLSLSLPALDVQGAGEGTANLKLTAVVRDSDSQVSFQGAVFGQPLPSEVQLALDSDDTLSDRLDQFVLFDVVTSICSQTD